MEEWYTPEWIFDKLNTTFDIDVCAPVGGIPWIPAKNHYSIKDDGLSQKWIGKVWCNPPFSQAGKWMEKFIAHGHGVALCPVSKSKWFYQMSQNPSVKIEFLPPDLKFIVGKEQKSVRSMCCLVFI